MNDCCPLEFGQNASSWDSPSTVLMAWTTTWQIPLLGSEPQLALEADFSCTSVNLFQVLWHHHLQSLLLFTDNIKVPVGRWWLLPFLARVFSESRGACSTKLSCCTELHQFISRLGCQKSYLPQKLWNLGCLLFIIYTCFTLERD